MQPTSVVIVMLGPSPRRAGSRRDVVDHRRAREVYNSTTASILVLGTVLLVGGSCLSLRYVLSGDRQDLVYVSVAMVMAGVFCLWLLVYHWRNHQHSNQSHTTTGEECSELEEVQIRDDEPPPYEPSTTPDDPSGRGYRDTTDLPPRYSTVVSNESSQEQYDNT